MHALMELVFGTGALVGRSATKGSAVRLKDPKRSTYIVGAHGTGKSTVMLNLILDDIEKDDKGVVVLDPHGDLARAVASRCPPGQAGRVLYFAPSEQRDQVLGLNPFELRHEREYELKVGALMDVFAHTWYGDFSRTPTLQNTLETLVRTLLIANPDLQTSFLDMLLATRLDEVGEGLRQKLAGYVQGNPALSQNWLEWRNERRLRDDIESSRQKIKHIIASDVLARILCQPRSAECFQFQEVLSQKGVLLVNLEGLDDEGQRLIGSILLNQLLVMARLRQGSADRTPCHIYADEFYKFSPQAFVTIINEARKYQLFCTLAHQNLEQLDKKAKAAAANCGNVIVFRVNPEDAAVLNKHFLANGQTLPAYALSNLPRFQALVRYADGNERRQARIRTCAEKGQENRAVASAIRQRSGHYGTPRDVIDRYLNAKLNLHDEQQNRDKRKPIRTRAKAAGDAAGQEE